MRHQIQKRFSITITICALLTVVLTAQGQQVRTYDDEQLSSNQITSLCQDRQGYIWIGTEYGLNKFDGVHFRQYYNDEDNTQSLFDNIVRQLFTDRDGAVWVVSNRGVQRYNRLTDSFEMVTFGDRPTANINDILQTGDGHVWLLGADDGVFQVNPQDLSAQPLTTVNRHLKKDCRFDNMFLDSRQRLWIGYEGRGLHMIDTKSGQARYFDEAMLQDRRAVDITESESHQLLIATYTALLRYDESTRRFENIADFPRMAVHRLFKGRDGQLLIGSSGSGLWAVDVAHGTCSTVCELTAGRSMDVSKDKVYAYLYDRDGNVWVGCHQRGLLFADAKPNGFHFFPLSQMATDNGNVLRTLYADREKNIYVCQEKGGIAANSPTGQTLHHWMGDRTVMSMYEAADGSFWVGTYRNGLFRLDRQTGREEHVASTGGWRIGSITGDRQGNLYVASFNDGLHCFTPDGKTERPLGGGGLELTNPYLNKLFTDRDGRIWIGHYYGIDVYDPKTDRLVDVGIPEPLRPAVVYAIAQSPHDNSVWIGSDKGLFQYISEKGKVKNDKGRWKRFTTKQGLPNNTVCGIVVDSDGTLWVSTYRGLARLGTDGTFIRYYRGNGLEEWAYLRGVYTWTGMGEVVLGNQNGVTYFNPRQMVTDEFQRGITLTGMRLGDIDVNASTLSDGSHILTKPLEETADISVSYLDNTFSLRFSSMDFRDAENVRYEFRFAHESGQPDSQPPACEGQVHGYAGTGGHRASGGAEGQRRGTDGEDYEGRQCASGRQ